MTKFSASFKTDTAYPDGVEIGPNFVHYDFSFTPIHQDFFVLSNLQFMYDVPVNYATHDTEIQIDRIRLNVYHNP